MPQSLPMKPGIGYPADGNIELLRKIVWNLWVLGGAGGLTPSFVPVPASSAAPGSAGQIAVDASYLYIYSAAAGGWRRTPIDDWA